MNGLDAPAPAPVSCGCRSFMPGKNAGIAWPLRFRRLSTQKNAKINARTKSGTMTAAAMVPFETLLLLSFVNDWPSCGDAVLLAKEPVPVVKGAVGALLDELLIVAKVVVCVPDVSVVVKRPADVDIALVVCTAVDESTVVVLELTDEDDGGP